MAGENPKIFGFRLWSTDIHFALHHRKRYVCVEPGHVRGFVALEPQTTWIGQQVISVGKEHPNL